MSIIGLLGNAYAIRLIHKRFKIDETELSYAAIVKLTEKIQYIRNLLICLAVFDMIYLVASLGIIGLPAFGLLRSGFFVHLIPFW